MGARVCQGWLSVQEERNSGFSMASRSDCTSSGLLAPAFLLWTCCDHRWMQFPADTRWWEELDWAGDMLAGPRRMRLPGGKEKKMCRAEETTWAQAKNILCPYSHPGACGFAWPFQSLHAEPSSWHGSARCLREILDIPVSHHHSSLCASILLCLTWPRNTWPSRPCWEPASPPPQWENTRLKQREKRTREADWEGPWATDSPPTASHDPLLYVYF